MDKKAVVALATSFRLALESRGTKAEKILLYGSCAAGTQREWSDIDLVVISGDFAGKSYWERVKILSEAIYEVFAPIEAVAMTQEEWERGDSMIMEFARDGEVLYAA